MNTLNKFKSTGACIVGCVAASMLWSRAAAAEVTLVEKDGWTFSFDGRVNAFLSVGTGDDFPKPTPNPNIPGTDHTVMGANKPGPGIADAGWPSFVQADANNKYFAMRVRSGVFGNVLGFGIKKQVNETTTIKAYVSIWSTIETLGRDKWFPVTAEAREGYFDVTGTWGSARVGRSLGWFGRMSTDIDFMYGHGYGVGLPCTDELGPACGHIGTGAIFPGYSAGASYSTPSLEGLQLHAGLYDPIVFHGSWEHAPYLRPEGALTFETKLADAGLLRLAVEGLYQPVARTVNPGQPDAHDEKTSVWGVAGGGRVELGPVRLGVAAFRGRGIGLSYALQNSSASVDANSGAAPPEGPSYELRTFSGMYGQAALMVGNLHVALGAGRAYVYLLDSDRRNYNLSVIQSQTGLSAAIYYHVSDSVVLGLDYFRFMAKWYGAPNSINDPNTGMQVQAPGALAAETQNLNFVNAGVTYHW